ncbi:MAG: arylsulfatase [Bacteroidota bacterium]
MKKILAIVLVTLSLGCSEKDTKKGAAVSKRDSPNVIYILADDLGYGDLGCFGQDKIKTPNLDRMAQEGIVFTDHYAGNTVCAPSRASLMTGLHQGHAPIRGNTNNVLRENTFTIGQLFKSAGYATALIGKWGLGDLGSSGTPDKQGFDHYFGYLNQILAHNYYPDYLIKDGDSVRLANEVVKATKGYAKGKGQAATVKKEYAHNLFIAEALSWIETHRNDPFFLYLPLTIPHANNEGTLTAGHGMEVPDLGSYAHRDWPDAEKAKAAMISLLDEDVGRILHLLQILGLDQNTMVIFTSDNGPHREGGVDPNFFDSNGPLRGTKRDLYEGGIRVPFITQWKGKIAPGAKSHLPSAFWDMMPTFAEVLHVDLKENTDGISLMPALLGNTAINARERTGYLYWEFGEGKYDAQAVREGKWKLLYVYRTDSWELYDLSKDIGENENVIAKHPAVAQRLKKRMAEAREPHGVYPLGD